MIELGRHWEFIAAAYAGSFVLIGALIIWTVLEARRARNRVEELEAERNRLRAAKSQ